MVGQLTAAAEDGGNVYKVGLNSTRLLMASGDVVTAWLLLRQAEVARRRWTPAPPAATRLSTRASSRRRSGSPATLPLLTSHRAVAESVDNALMDLPEEAF